MSWKYISLTLSFIVTSANAEGYNPFYTIDLFHRACLQPAYDFSANPLPPPLDGLVKIEDEDFLNKLKASPETIAAMWLLPFSVDKYDNAVFVMSYDPTTKDRVCKMIISGFQPEQFLETLTNAVGLTQTTRSSDFPSQTANYRYEHDRYVWNIQANYTLDPADTKVYMSTIQVGFPLN